MTDLTPEDRALIERVLGYDLRDGFVISSPIILARLIDAARTEGRESRPSGGGEPTLEALHTGAEKYREVSGRAAHFSAFMQGVYAVLAASPSVGAETQPWRPDREAVARLIHFMHGDGLSAADAMHANNDAHWDFWKNDPPHADAWKAADAILSLPSQGTGKPANLRPALQSLMDEWHRQAAAYDKDEKHAPHSEQGKIARAYAALLARVASDLKLTISSVYATPVSQGKAQEGWKPTHRHVKSGGYYQVVERARDITNEHGEAGVEVVIYRGVGGHTWVRRASEFDDGRFEPIAAAPAQPGALQQAGGNGA